MLLALVAGKAQTQGIYAGPKFPGHGETLELDLSGMYNGYSTWICDDGGPYDYYGAGYEDGGEAYIHLTAPENCNILLTGLSITESGYDWLIIYSGSFVSEDNFIGYFDEETPNIGTIMGNELLLEFHSDQSVQMSGIEIKVKIVGESLYTNGDFVFTDAAKTCLVAYTGDDTDVTIPSTVTTIEPFVFAYKGISSVDFSEAENLTTIGTLSFAYCGLEEIEIPDNLGSIGRDAFLGITNLIYNNDEDPDGTWGAAVRNAVFDDEFMYNYNYTVIGSYIGESSDVVIPSTVTAIGPRAFKYRGNLTSIDFSGATQLSTIGEEAFYDCENLTEVDLSTTKLTTIGTGAFYNCSSLNTVTLPSTVEYYGCAAFANTDLRAIEFSDELDNISVSRYAFYSCNLTAVTIPTSVKSMGKYVFYRCDELEEIVCGASEKPDGWDEDWNYNDGVYFPVVWSDFDGTPVEAYQIDGDYDDYGLSEDYNGYYVIASAANLYWFAEYVNSGEGASANAVLVNDIVVNKDVLDEEGNLNGDLDDNNFIQWTPIGAEESEIYFLGTFDGNGHTISGLYFFDESCGTAGLIANCYEAIIKNVGVIDSYLHGDFDVGGILGYSDGSSSISNCFNTSTIIASDGCAGGICGYNGGCLINNCFNTGKISGDHYVGAIVGQKDHVIRNCYYLSGCATDGAGTIQNGVGSEELDNTVEDAEGLNSATTGEFKSGYVAYALNGYSSNEEDVIYFQRIGKDATPCLDSNRGVVFSGNDMHPYSNDETGESHVFDSNGFCYCGEYEDPDYDEDGTYLIYNAGQLYWFANHVNESLENVGDNASLMRDIVINEYVLNADGDLNGYGSNFRTWWVPIGDSYPYHGYFDGRGHTISGLYFNDGNDGFKGLFKVVGSSAVIRDLGVIDSYIFGSGELGAIAVYLEGGKIINCYSTSTIFALSNDCGGICGTNLGGTITNCFFAGRVLTEGAYAGAIVGKNEDDEENDREAVIENCFYLAECASTLDGDVQGGIGSASIEAMSDVEGQYVAATADEFASGKIAYLLNDYLGYYDDNEEGGDDPEEPEEPENEDENIYWYQGLGENGDAIPSFESDRGMVYQTSPCVTYTNDEEDTYLEHDYDNNGICSRCGDDNGPVGPSLHQIADADDAANFGLSEDYINFYTIGNSDELYLFAEMVNSGSNTANAVLVDDITVNNGVLDTEGELDVEDPEVIDFMAWTPIGTNNLNYSGTFDGNGHTISGLYFQNSQTYGVGLFGYVAGTIRNVGVLDSYFEGYSQVGGICGTISGNATIAYCSNAATVVAASSNSDGDAGGICGYMDNSNAIIEYCHNTGKITASHQIAGGICGRQFLGAISNCYNTGSVMANNNFVGGISGYVESESEVYNCYNTGNIEGYSQVGGIVGRLDYGYVYRCFNTGKISANFTPRGIVGFYNSGNIYDNYLLEGSGDADYATTATAEEFASGYVAYQINYNASETVYYQTLGENGDAIPSFDSNRGTVYMTSPCESYGNSEYKAHDFDNGFCTVCGAFEEADYDEEANVYLIANAGQLYWFANYVNSGNTTANAELTADITVNNGVLDTEGELNTDNVDDFMAWTPIGYDDYPFEGTFNGNGYTVNGLYFYNEDGSSYPIGGRFVGLVGYSNGANIRNVGLVDSYLNGYWNVAGICGFNYDEGAPVTIEKCWNASTIEGYGAVAGIFSEGPSTITSCYNLGTISGDNYVAGIVAYSENGNVSMCFNVGTVSGSSQVGGIYGQHNGYAYECYVLDGRVSSNNANGGDFATREQFRSGYVAYEINNYAGTNVFYQTLGKDAIPTLDNTHGQVTQTGPCVTYNNTGTTYKDHEYENGMCACGLIEPASQDDDGIYHIANAGQLYWFANYANNTDSYASAVLDDNIVVNEDVLNDDGTLSSNSAFFKEWTPIGTENNYYYGIFDGQGHTISGLYFYNTTYETYPNGGKYVGLIGASGGATIQNVGVIDSYLHGSFDVGGILGYSSGSSSITNCFNTSTIIASNSNDDASCAGGICGYNGYCTINNCYNTGKVGGNGYYIGAIVGQKAENGEIYNCYYLSGCAIDGGDTEQNGVGASYLYETTDDVNREYEAVSAEDFASGAVAYMLNENDEYVWYQDLYADELPSLDGSKTLVTGYIQDLEFVLWAVGDVVLATDYEIAEDETLVVEESASLATTNDAEITVNGKILFTGGSVYYGDNQTVLGNKDENGAVVCYNSYSNGQMQVVAEPADGYHFYKWNDESTNTTRTISLNAPGEYYAMFEPITYQVTVLATDGGTVSGAEDVYYTYGENVSIYATPGEGNFFVNWSNGDVYTSTSIYVKSDTVVSAEFLPIQTVVEGEANVVGYYREVQYNPNCVFTASTTGTYVITTKAGFDTYGYLYDGNKGYITYNDDAETNQFKIYHDCEEGETYYIGAAFYHSDNVGEEINLLVKAPVKVEAEVIGEGYVEGTGTYTWGNSVTLTAHAGEGYKFYRWSNGYTQETLTFKADEDTTFVAQFIDENLNIYIVSAYPNDYELGYVEGSGVFIEGETTTLTANATDHYHFVQWNDGDNTNPRSVEVTDNLEFEAIFAIDTFYVSVVADNGEVVYGEGEYAWGEYAYIGVEANTGYHFSYWADDNTTSRTRSYLVQGNATLTAVIEPNYYDVDATYVGNGSIEGIGNYAFGTEVTLTAVPATGYHFVKWSDDVTTAKRTVTVSTSNNNYLAYFEINTYDVTVETEHGTVDGVKNGKYTHGEEATFTAVADANYKFARWTTTNTTNPFVTNVTSNMVLRPLFIPENASIYELTVSAGEGGSASGSGSYVTNEKVSLTATPNEGYSFVKWSTGSTSNPLEYTVTGTATVTAQFAINSYELKVLAGANGTVKGGGTFTYGSSADISATAADGYHFAKWSDGNTTAERTVTVNNNLELTAEFAINTYAVKATAKNGKVEGTGTYNHGDEATLTAVANTGYHFTKWSDGETAATRKATVKSDLNFTAEFEINSYDVTVSAANGTVTGAGSYEYGAKAQLSATAAEGYHFAQWNDGDTRATRTIVVTEDLAFTAEFEINSYTVRASATNGTVEGAGTYNHGAEATLTATANTGFHFSKWSDGVETATRKVTVTDNLSFKAEFAANTYTISVEANDNGTITGAGSYEYGAEATLKATANTGYHFVMWSDELKTATRTVEVTSNASFSAVFEVNTYELAVKAKNGTVEGAGTYNFGAEATLTATAKAGYRFSKWDDGNTDNPRKVTVTGNKTYTAKFTRETYAVNVNGRNGNISLSSGTLEFGATITLTAVPDSGYHFVMWSDSVLDNPRTVTLTAELLRQVTANGFEFTAIFEKDDDNTAVADEAVEAVNIFAYGNTIVVENAVSDIFVYNAMGRLIERVAAEAGRTEIKINGAGIYVVKTGNTAKRVMIND